MTPKISIVVIGFDMARELPRTVQSLLPPYQRDVAIEAMEIIVVDNGSTTPVGREDFPAEAPITVIRVDDGGVSPCRAINRGAALARGERVAVMIDGARMASPGLIAAARAASRTDSAAIVATLGFHLGPKTQQVSVLEGYDRVEEDRLLAGIGWPADGYRLFEISALGESYARGVLAAPPETTFLMMGRGRWHALGGFDERFTSLGGGFAGFDFFARAVGDQAPLILLVGEGTFHQLHYGATTRADGVRRPAPQGDGSLGDLYAREYVELTGRAHGHPDVQPLLYGRLTHPAARRLFLPDDDR